MSKILCLLYLYRYLYIGIYIGTKPRDRTEIFGKKGTVSSTSMYPYNPVQVSSQTYSPFLSKYLNSIS